MAERAHPDQFKRFKKIKIFGIIPFFKSNPYRKAFFWRYKIAKQYCSKKIVLDVPCGMGWGTSLLKNSEIIYAVDISRDAIHEAKKKYKGIANFMVGDMNKLDFEDEKFDTIICLEGFEHVLEEVGEHFLNESYRVLKEKGVLVLSSPYPLIGNHSGNPFHLKEYKPQEMREKFLKHGFKIIKEFKKKVDNLTMTVFVVYKQIKI